MAEKVEAACKKKRSRSKSKKPLKKRASSSQDERIPEKLSSATSSRQESETNITNSTINFINSIDLSQFADLGFTLPNLKSRRSTKKALEQVVTLSRKAHKINNLRELAAKRSEELKGQLADEEGNISNQGSQSRGSKNISKDPKEEICSSKEEICISNEEGCVSNDERCVSNEKICTSIDENCIPKEESYISKEERPVSEEEVQIFEEVTHISKGREHVSKEASHTSKGSRISNDDSHVSKQGSHISKDDSNISKGKQESSVSKEDSHTSKGSRISKEDRLVSKHRSHISKQDSNISKRSRISKEDNHTTKKETHISTEANLASKGIATNEEGSIFKEPSDEEKLESSIALSKSLTREFSIQLDQLRQLTARSSTRNNLLSESFSKASAPHRTLSNARPETSSDLEPSEYIQPKNVNQIIRDNAKIINHPLAKSNFRNIEGPERVLSITFPESEDDDTDESTLKDLKSDDQTALENKPHSEKTANGNEFPEENYQNPYGLGGSPQTVAWMMEQYRRIEGATVKRGHQRHQHRDGQRYEQREGHRSKEDKKCEQRYEKRPDLRYEDVLRFQELVLKHEKVASKHEERTGAKANYRDVPESPKRSRQEKIDPDTFLKKMPKVTREDSYTSVVTKFNMAKTQIVQIIDQIRNKSLVYADNEDEDAQAPPLEEMEQCKTTLDRIRTMRKSIEAEKKKIERYTQEAKAKKEAKERSKKVASIQSSEGTPRRESTSRQENIPRQESTLILESIPRSETSHRSEIAPRSETGRISSSRVVRNEERDPKEKKKHARKKKPSKEKSILELYKAEDYDSCMDLLDKLINVKKAICPVLSEIQKETSKLNVDQKKRKGPLCCVSKVNFARATEASRIFRNLGKGEQKYDIPAYLTDMIVNSLCYADCIGKEDLPEQDRVYVDADTLRQLLNFYETLGTLISKLQEADNLICNRACIDTCPGPASCQGRVCGEHRQEIETLAAASQNAKMEAKRQISNASRGSRLAAFFTHT